jgi:hypothetical protein
LTPYATRPIAGNSALRVAEQLRKLGPKDFVFDRQVKASSLTKLQETVAHILVRQKIANRADPAPATN